MSTTTWKVWYRQAGSGVRVEMRDTREAALKEAVHLTTGDWEYPCEVKAIEAPDGTLLDIGDGSEFAQLVDEGERRVFEAERVTRAVDKWQIEVAAPPELNCGWVLAGYGYYTDEMAVRAKSEEAIASFGSDRVRIVKF
jgi:hypothetical protein